MAVSPFTFRHFFIRFIAAVALVFATYSPLDKLSYYRWAIEPMLKSSEGGPFSAAKALVGLLVLIGWVVFLRATHRSLGAIGLFLALAFFAILVWLLVEQGWITIDSTSVLTWLVLISVAGVMAVGMSWSHVRRRMSGQLDTDDADGGAT
jgi:Family of unknown function (DUF6524)